MVWREEAAAPGYPGRVPGSGQWRGAGCRRPGVRVCAGPGGRPTATPLTPDVQGTTCRPPSTRRQSKQWGTRVRAPRTACTAHAHVARCVLRPSRGGLTLDRQHTEAAETCCALIGAVAAVSARDGQRDGGRDRGDDGAADGPQQEARMGDVGERTVARPAQQGRHVRGVRPSPTTRLARSFGVPAARGGGDPARCAPGHHRSRVRRISRPRSGRSGRRRCGSRRSSCS